MFGSSHFGLPRLKPLSSKRSHIVSVLDIGSTKVVCMIGRLTPREESQVLPDRTHQHRDHRHRPPAFARHQVRRHRRSRRGRGRHSPCGRRRRAHGRPHRRKPHRQRLGRPARQRRLYGDDRSRRPGSREQRPEEGADCRLPAVAAPGPRGAAFAADRLFARRRARHPRSAVACSATRSASTCMWSRPNAPRCAISSSASTARIFRSKAWWRRPMPAALPLWSTTKSNSAALPSTWAAARRRSRSLPKASWCIPMPSASAAITSPPIWRAASRPASRTPSG